MLRSKVLVVDHVTDHWKKVNFPGTNGQVELQVLDDGLDAYMECAQNDFQTLLIRADMPGVSGDELARTVLDQQPDARMVLFGCDDSEAELDESVSSIRTEHVSSNPTSPEEASQLLEDVVGTMSPAAT
jgi:DNA-binding NarL/FixJ family response regulator